MVSHQYVDECLPAFSGLNSVPLYRAVLAAVAVCPLVLLLSGRSPAAPSLTSLRC